MEDVGAIRPVRIEEEMRLSYLDYAMSVIVSRALPDVRDGLKPVHRRILYAMQDLGLRPTSPYKKSARIVGEVLGKYHPHGDAAVYEAMVRLAQDFSMRYPLVDGQGNFGSVDNDPPAAMRYTEARLSPMALEMLADIEQNTVDFTPNFDGSLQEPQVLPARLPNLLVNGSTGIAVGMATSIPPHNLSEVCDGVTQLLDNPGASVDDLLRIIKGPDFPTGAIIQGREGIIAGYTTGHGRIVVRARASIEEMGRGGRYVIIITELPYQVNKAALVERIAFLARDRRLPGIAEVRDESDREGLRVVVELRREAQPQVTLKNLYKHTAMQSAFSVNMLALVEGQPRVIGLKAALQHYIQFRRQVIERRSRFQLERAQERAHILEGLLLALEKLDQVIATIRRSRDAESARQALMAGFSLTQVQAQAILDMQLRRLAALERQRIAEEHAELQKAIARLQGILADPKKMDDLIREDMASLKKAFGDGRRTVIQREEAREYQDEELIPHQMVVVTLSRRGYIKRVPLDAYRLQRRGGRGITGMVTREEDAVQHLLVADTHHSLLFFTDRGKVYQLKCHELPADVSRAAKGTPLVNLVSLAPGEQVTALLAAAEFDRGRYLVLATRKGQVKKTPLGQFASVRSNGLIAFKLKGDDELVSAQLAGNEDRVILVTERGRALRCPVSAVPSRARGAGGVRGIRLAPEDRVVALEVEAGQGHLLTITARGYGKRTPVASYPVQRRGGQGLLTFRLSDKTGALAAAKVVRPSQELMLVSAEGIALRTSADTISAQRRLTKGVSVMKLGDGDGVVSITCLDSGEEPGPAGGKAPRARAPAKKPPK